MIRAVISNPKRVLVVVVALMMMFVFMISAWNWTDEPSSSSSSSSSSREREREGLDPIKSMNTTIYSKLRNITPKPRETTPWPAYRLGDVFKHHQFRFLVPKHRENWPGSLAVEYVDRLIDPMHSGDAEFDVMFNIIQNRSTSPLIQSLLPDDHTLVIHLRTGDVIDNDKMSVSQMWDCRVCGGDNIYTRGRPFYHEIWDEIQKEKISIDRILLITGWHFDIEHSRSIEFINKVIEFMEGLVETVDIRFNEIPDEDVLIMANSNYFVLSGGSFSRMIAELVNMNGGKVFGNDTVVGQVMYRGQMVIQ